MFNLLGFYVVLLTFWSEMIFDKVDHFWSIIQNFFHFISKTFLNQQHSMNEAACCDIRIVLFLQERWNL
jgi:hypothetical protein